MTTKPYRLELLLDLKGCELSDLPRKKLEDYFIQLLPSIAEAQGRVRQCLLVQGVRHRRRQEVQRRILAGRIGRLHGGHPDLN